MQDHTWMNKWEEEKKEAKKENIAQLEQPKRFFSYFICFDYQHVSMTENKVCFFHCVQREKERETKKKEARLYTWDKDKQIEREKKNRQLVLITEKSKQSMYIGTSTVL
jgi:hypothetical protein